MDLQSVMKQLEAWEHPKRALWTRSMARATISSA
jgi:hypothetical protein